MSLKLRTLAVTVAAIALLGGVAVGQESDTVLHDVNLNVDEIALIDVDDDTTIDLTITEPASGGDVPAADTDKTKYLQYTSVVSTSGNTRTITAELGSASPEIPAGTQLEIESNDPSGNGTPGSSSGQVVVLEDTTAGDIVTGIGSCNTSEGAKMTFTFSVTDVGALVADDDGTVEVIYTLTEDS